MATLSSQVVGTRFLCSPEAALCSLPHLFVLRGHRSQARCIPAPATSLTCWVPDLPRPQTCCAPRLSISPDLPRPQTFCVPRPSTSSDPLHPQTHTCSGSALQQYPRHAAFQPHVPSPARPTSGAWPAPTHPPIDPLSSLIPVLPPPLPQATGPSSASASSRKSAHITPELGISFGPESDLLTLRVETRDDNESPHNPQP